MWDLHKELFSNLRGCHCNITFVKCTDVRVISVNFSPQNFEECFMSSDRMSKAWKFRLCFAFFISCVGLLKVFVTENKVSGGEELIVPEPTTAHPPSPHRICAIVL